MCVSVSVLSIQAVARLSDGHPSHLGALFVSCARHGPDGKGKSGLVGAFTSSLWATQGQRCNEQRAMDRAGSWELLAWWVSAGRALGPAHPEFHTYEA